MKNILTILLFIPFGLSGQFWVQPSLGLQSNGFTGNEFETVVLKVDANDRYSFSGGKLRFAPGLRAGYTFNNFSIGLGYTLSAQYQKALGATYYHDSQNLTPSWNQTFKATYHKFSVDLDYRLGKILISPTFGMAMLKADNEERDDNDIVDNYVTNNSGTHIYLSHYYKKKMPYAGLGASYIIALNSKLSLLPGIYFNMQFEDFRDKEKPLHVAIGFPDRTLFTDNNTLRQYTYGISLALRYSLKKAE